MRQRRRRSGGGSWRSRTMLVQQAARDPVPRHHERIAEAEGPAARRAPSWPARRGCLGSDDVGLGTVGEGIVGHQPATSEPSALNARAIALTASASGGPSGEVIHGPKRRPPSGTTGVLPAGTSTKVRSARPSVPLPRGSRARAGAGILALHRAKERDDLRLRGRKPRGSMLARRSRIRHGGSADATGSLSKAGAASNSRPSTCTASARPGRGARCRPPRLRGRSRDAHEDAHAGACLQLPRDAREHIGSKR